MAFKMKGDPFKRNFPNDLKSSPTKWINFLIMGVSALASASKKKETGPAKDPASEFSTMKFGNKK